MNNLFVAHAQGLFGFIHAGVRSEEAMGTFADQFTYSPLSLPLLAVSDAFWVTLLSPLDWTLL
jgi:hypothetical protein